MNGRMGWCAWLGATLAGTAAWAGTFDGRGVFHAQDAALWVHFDSAASLAAQQVTVVEDRTGRVVAHTEEELGSYLLEGEGDSLEGTGHLSVAGTPAQKLKLSVPLQNVAAGRVEIRVWAKATPTLPSLTVVWGLDAAHQTTAGHVLTGRATSDGWVELSSGPLDSTVLGWPLARVEVAGGGSVVELDALEVTRLGDAAVPDGAACTLANVEQACGTWGECIYGTCVDSNAVWGPAPYTQAHRAEYVARLGHALLHFAGDREAVNARGAEAAAALDALATAASPRAFWHGVNLAITRFRDAHAWPPTLKESSASAVASYGAMETDAGLGVCFGVMNLDLLDGRRGYGVFGRVEANPLLGQDVHVGDVLTAVDNEPVDAWLTRAESVGGNLRSASDEGSLPAWRAVWLSALVAQRAGTVTLLRCESATSCQAPVQVVVDVGARVRAHVVAQGRRPAAAVPCDHRFANAVTAPTAPDPEGFTVYAERADNLATLQFDGTYFSTQGNTKLTQTVQGSSAVLMDVRLGNGGTFDAVRTLVGLVRDATQPVWLISGVRTWDGTDREGQEDLAACLDDSPNVTLNACWAAEGLAPSTTAVSPQAKVAVLLGADVSGNDLLAAGLKGRSQLRMFGPGPTAGAYGGIMGTSPLLPHETRGGTLQFSDSLMAADPSLLNAAPFISGQGIPPDEVLAQKQSDALQGKDTLLERARAWLMEAP